MISQLDCERVLDEFSEMDLIRREERDAVLGVFKSCFPFAEALALADTIHVHVKVDDVFSLPHERIKAAGGRVEHGKDGYIKYQFPGGVNMIFSSINISQDDLAESCDRRRRRPFVDHIGIDLRQTRPAVRSAFDALRAIAHRIGWTEVPQGSPERPVFCCHVQVSEKHWAFPPSTADTAIPLEFAYGPLVVNALKSGCDLRPATPGTAAAAGTQTATSCSAASG